VAELSEYGRMLQLSGARILKIVENLLFWAKLEAPQSPAEGSAKLMETQEDVTAEGLRSIAEQASKQFGRQYDVSVDCPRRARIQVITPGFEFVTKHLVENALKYSLPRTPVRISVTTDADELTLSVSDSGRGMTRDEFDRIRRSGHLEHDRNRQPGLGMGLMLATAFVRKSGGRLDLQPNDKGKGLTVLMHLPLAAESVPPS
ncbi:MAG: HAMP domain-containing sensor histidine kinase, partial [Opitutaceae bacterium]